VRRNSDWLAWLRTFLILLGTILAGSYVFLVLIDPYDAGRFPSIGISGIIDESPRTAHASRGRNQAFDSAVFGNSTGQLIDPRRLSHSTGLHFAQMTVPGTGPREQLTLLRYFSTRHTSLHALVLVADETWCTQDPLLPIKHPFPFWLYGNWREYLAHLLSPHSFDLALRRIRLAFGSSAPTDPAGYWDYEVGRDWNFRPEPVQRQQLLPMPTAGQSSFTAILGFREFMSELPASVSVVIVMPPNYTTAIPEQGSLGAAILAKCKFNLAGLVAGRLGSGFLDFKVDTELTRDPTNFLDPVHYRARVARYIEDSIAAVIAQQHASGL
jgi:hypothetical protein